MEKGVFKISSKPEKIICATTLSVVLAILFDGKKKKPNKQKNFIQRISSNYKVIDGILSHIFLKDLKNAEVKKAKLAKDKDFQTKLCNLEIEDAKIIDL